MDPQIRFLLVLKPFSINNGMRHLHPGDILVQAIPDAETYVEHGSARWIGIDEWSAILTEKAKNSARKAKPVTALAGMPGLATGGEYSGDDLVGRVPITPERRRKP